MAEPFELVIDPELIAAPKNSDGALGDRCNNCGGYGYTTGIKGNSLGCFDCEGTGIKLQTRQELTTRIDKIESMLKNLIVMEAKNE